MKRKFPSLNQKCSRCSPMPLLILGLIFLAIPTAAKVLISVEAALQKAFPDCEVQRSTVYLTE